jgi:hypothetical protein
MRKRPESSSSRGEKETQQTHQNVLSTCQTHQRCNATRFDNFISNLYYLARASRTSKQANIPREHNLSNTEM